MANLNTKTNNADYEELIKKIVEGEMLALNSEKGQEAMQRLLDETLKQNPNVTAEEWSTIKKNFIKVVFEKTIAEHPELLKSLAENSDESEGE